MNILIDTIRIAGFRGIKNLEVSLPRVTILIGTNNSGKTSLLKAMQLALGDYSRYLSEEDFHIGANNNRVSEILVDVRIVPVDDDGVRTQIFNDEWVTEFGDKIKAEANGNQFVAIRTRATKNPIKGSFDSSRSTLERWPNLKTWQTENIKETKIRTRLESIPFISIEAQRDIHHELKERTSFIGKVLSSVEDEYDPAEITTLESLISDINDEAVNKSSVLQNLKTHLEKLNYSFEGSGSAEIMPFPKKIRDLSKHFSIHVGESSSNTFPMEYHGMGTRSWASMLTVKAFTDLMAAKHEKEVKPFFPILAAEEPEAHLHPNAQKTLYCQLAKSKGQVIVSTHSPYLVAMADVNHIRSLRKESTGIVANKLLYNISDEDKKILAREITIKRGEILFSRALLLCEGITEEQVLPAMFEVYIGKSLCDLGISCISVGGKNYSPFVKLACSLGIPTFIVSDNDGSTKEEIEAQLRSLRKDTELALESDIFGVSYLSSKNDFEAELLLQTKLRDEIISALVSSETNRSGNQRYRAAKLNEITALQDQDLLLKMRGSKASYAGFLADVLRENPNNRTANALLPSAVIDAFNAIKGWLSI